MRGASNLRKGGPLARLVRPSLRSPPKLLRGSAFAAVCTIAREAGLAAEARWGPTPSSRGVNDLRGGEARWCGSPPSALRCGRAEKLPGFARATEAGLAAEAGFVAKGAAGWAAFRRSLRPSVRGVNSRRGGRESP